MKNLVKLRGYTFLFISVITLHSCNKDKPNNLPESETLDVSEITQTTAKSGGNIIYDGGVEITAKGICWNIEVNPDISDDKTVDGSGTGSFVSTMTSLQPGTTYYLRAYATNSNGTAYGDEKSFKTLSDVPSGQIIADHRIVADFDKIPAYYINEVKKMWFDLPGESHGTGVCYGVGYVQQDYGSTYKSVYTQSGTPEAYTTDHLRISEASWGDISTSSGWIYSYGEEDWWTTAAAIARTKAGLSYCNSNGLAPSAFGFGWCSDMDWLTVASTGTDPVYGCHWFGMSDGGPQGSRCWGLDDEDNSVSGNTVNLDTYLNATQQYIDYCTANSIPTKVFFTTGPVNNLTSCSDEAEYQSWLKMERIRNYVKADPTRILFDYADILCYNDDGSTATRTWNGHPIPCITTTNLGSESIGHIGRAGCLRLGKAVWWMLARMAGWDGGTGGTVPVTGITVTGAGGATAITTDKGTLQLSATVLPANATNQTVTWSISSGTKASISSTGLVTAIDDGTATARATANDGSGVYGTLTITISNQVIPVTSITVTGAGGATTIATDKGTLQLSAAVLPANATNKAVTWSLTNGTGQATINSTGLVTATANGAVTAKATANDGSGVSGTLVITISNQVTIIPVSGITVAGTGGATAITTNNATLQLNAAVTPSDATNKTVTWSISNGTGQATINSTGLVTAAANGTVTARATANDGSGVSGTFVITISNQVILVTGITVTGAGGATTITTDNATLQLSAAITPSNATNKAVTWSISNGTGQASISTSGLVTAMANGTVTAKATAADGSGVSGTLVITISNQVIPVKGITVTALKGATSITTNHGTLELNAVISPSNATNQKVLWSVINGTGQASINSSGILTAISNGTVTVQATAADGSGVYGNLVITISNQVILVTGITVTGIDGATTIATDNGSLQLSAVITPGNATDQTMTWTIVNGTGQATISTTGLVTAISSGTVTAQATVNDGSGVTGTMDITIFKSNNTEQMVVIVNQNEIKFPLDESYLDCKISLYDLNGNLMLAKLVDSDICVFDIAVFRTGLYIAVLSNNMIRKVAKVIIP